MFYADLNVYIDCVDRITLLDIINNTSVCHEIFEPISETETCNFAQSPQVNICHSFLFIIVN